MKVSIGQAAKELGVSRETLRRWEAQGKITVERTPKGHRRYDLAQLHGILPRTPPKSAERVTLAYARVSNPEADEELTRQIALLESFCTANGWNYEIVEDIGSGMNYRRRGLRHLLRRICSGEIGRLVVIHQDRLLRFGSELVFAVCEQFGTEVVMVNTPYEDSGGEEDISKDVQEILDIFAARLYGSRHANNKQLLDKLRAAAASATRA